jgi:phospholipase C
MPPGTRRVLVAVVLPVLLAGCSPPVRPSTVSTTGTPVAVSTPLSRPSAAASGEVAPGAHVFVIVMENTTYDQALAQPYTRSLAEQYALASDYHAVSHPSLPNYLALTAGSTFGIRDDSYRPLPAGGLGAQLTQAGVSWKAYAEGMAGDCLTNTTRYAVKHDPFAFYGGACPANVVAMDQLAGDLTGTTPRLSWLIPDLCHDGHDCPAATADGWLAATVPAILASPAWKDGGVLFITWDEDDGSGDNHVATLVVAPRLASHTTAVAYDHYSLLATIEDRLGVSRLGQAATATPITDVLAG